MLFFFFVGVPGQSFEVGSGMPVRRFCLGIHFLLVVLPVATVRQAMSEASRNVGMLVRS